MTRVVISQPMFFPWVGLFEQIRLADTFIYYDDVQFSKGSFTNRVQVKTAAGSVWLTVPLRQLKLGQLINEVVPDRSKDWKRRHLELLANAFADAPYVDEMLGLVQRVYDGPCSTVADVSIASIDETCRYFDIADPSTFRRSSSLGIVGKSSQRVLDIVQSVGGTTYITGHGAQKYLDHELFESHNIRVEYMAYQKLHYPQLHGDFTPFVSALDLIANVGKGGRDIISSGTDFWRDFVS